MVSTNIMQFGSIEEYDVGTRDGCEVRIDE